MSPWMVLWLVVACSGEPQTLADCDRVRDSVAREDCRLSLLHGLFEAGDDVAFLAGLAQVDDPLSRDLVRLRLAVESPDRAGWLCEGVETENAQDKCRQVLGRPHLRAPREGEPR